MPIVLSLIVERELARRAYRATFDAWRRATARRLGVERRWREWLQHNGCLLRALLRFWAHRHAMRASEPTVWVWTDQSES